MKRKFISFVSLLACLMMSVCTLASCSSSNNSSSSSSSSSSSNSSSSLPLLTLSCGVLESTDTLLVIKVQKAEESQTLLDVMQILKDVAGEISYTLSGTMISGINGKENPADFSSCWMLYTSDAEMANTEWGTYVYDGATYGSAVVGADALPVIDGGIYVWFYQSF